MPETLTSGTKALSVQVAPVIWQVPHLTPCTPSLQSDQVPILVWPQSQTPCSIEQFINHVITQKQPGLVPLRRDRRQRNSWAFTPSQSKASLILLPESSIPAMSLCPFTWLATHLYAFCFTKSWQFTASCLGSHPELNLHLSLQLTSQLPAPDVFLNSWKGSWKMIKFQLPRCEQGHLS